MECGVKGRFAPIISVYTVLKTKTTVRRGRFA